MGSSGVLDAETTAAVEEARLTLWDLLATARVRARSLFVAFLLGFLGCFYALRLVVWPALERDLLATGATVVATTPFDVVLLQTKLSLAGGGLLALPALLYLARGSLRARGLLPTVSLPLRWVVPALAAAAALFVVGVAYAYVVLFPFLFGFLTRNALQAGFEPTYSIVAWTQFVLLLSLAMGVAAELPLLMSLLTALGVVEHAFFREKWRHAVVAIAVVASVVNGSPDPVSMTLVAAPLVALYGVGLVCTRVVDSVVGSEGVGGDAARSTPPVASSRPAPPSTLEATLADGTGFGPVVDRVGTRLVDELGGERDPDDVGGYYYDLRFVAESLRSRSFLLVGWFAVVLVATFAFLSGGGLRLLRRDFLSQLPPGVAPAELNVVLLHPLEVLLFAMSASAVVAAGATLPALVYLAWPALERRGLVAGRRRTVSGGAGALAIGLLAGSYVGYAVIAPALISALVADATGANVIVAYRVSAFFWLVLYTTVGVGLLADVPVAMALVERAGVVPFDAMWRRWREVVFVAAAVAILLPGGTAVAILLAVPVLAAYAVGLLAVGVLTLGGRRPSRRPLRTLPRGR